MARPRTTPPRRAGQRRIIAAVLAALVAVPFALVPASAGAAARGPAPAALGSPAPQVRGLHQAGGALQFATCAGPVHPGRPTVVLVGGLGAGTADFVDVMRGLSRTDRVCRYDRPGLGRSPARPLATRLSAGKHAAELAALLDVIGVTGPVVVVGHSYGGMVARAFGVKYPERLAGLVLVDSVYPTQWYSSSSSYWPEANTSINMAASQSVVANGPRLGRRPLVVLTAGRGSSSGWNYQQAQMTRLAERAEHVVVTRSSHTIQVQRPAAVVLAAQLAVRAAVRHRYLPRCASVAAAWATAGARCT